MEPEYFIPHSNTYLNYLPTELRTLGEDYVRYEDAYDRIILEIDVLHNEFYVASPNRPKFRIELFMSVERSNFNSFTQRIRVTEQDVNNFLLGLINKLDRYTYEDEVLHDIYGETLDKYETMAFMSKLRDIQRVIENIIT